MGFIFLAFLLLFPVILAILVVYSLTRGIITSGSTDSVLEISRNKKAGSLLFITGSLIFIAPFLSLLLFPYWGTLSSFTNITFTTEAHMDALRYTLPGGMMILVIGGYFLKKKE